MTSLVTGGAGFAGSHLVDYLLAQGHEVTVLARRRESLRHLEHALPHLRVEEGDLLDAERIRGLLGETRPERLFHLAALSSPLESVARPRLAYEINLVGTLNLLDAWRQAGFDSRCLLVSSSQVYGAVPEASLPAREHLPLHPLNPYAASKAAAELVGLQFVESYGLPVIRVRPFNHTGPRQEPTFVCSYFARQLAEIERGLRPAVLETGDLEPRRDFSDVRDIVRGYAMLLEGGRPGEVYQLCSGRPVSVRSILETLLAMTHRSVEVRVDSSRLRPGEVAVTWGDAAKAEQEVGWRPQYRLEETLRDLKEYWEARVG